MIARLHTQSFHSFAPQRFEIHFIFSIAGIVGGSGATGVELVFKIGAAFCDGGDFVFGEDFLAGKFLEFWDERA